MIKNVILDVGRVLVTWDPQEAMRKLGFDEKTMQKVSDATVNTPLWGEADRGVMSDEELLAAFCEKEPAYEKEIKLFWENINLALVQFDYTKDWIRELKAEGKKVYILSNYGAWSYQQTCDKTLDFLPLTDGGIFSYTVKKIKPEPEIYHMLLDKYQLKPEECVFFDDTEQNILAAEKEGIHGIWFHSIDQAKADLKKIC